MRKQLLKQPWQDLRVDAPSVVLHAKAHLSILRARDAQLDRRRVPGVDDHVFHQIAQHLLDQHRVHRHHQQLIRYAHAHGHRVILAEFVHRLGGDLLRSLRRLFELHGAVVDARDGQDVFHQANQPLRVIAHLPDQLLLVLIAERVIVLQHDGGGADDRRQRRAQIVRHAAQQVGLHLLPLGLGLNAALALDLLGQHAHNQRHREHRHRRQRIAGQRKIELEIWIGKCVIDAEHRCDGGKQAVEVSVREARRQQHGQHKDKRHRAVAFPNHIEPCTQERCRRQQGERDAQIADDFPSALPARNQRVPKITKNIFHLRNFLRFDGYYTISARQVRVKIPFLRPQHGGIMTKM